MKDNILLFISLIIFVIVFPSYSFSKDDEMNSLVENIKKICQSPSERDSYWNVSLKGDGKARIKFIGAVSGEADFSKGEWSGIQRVLKAHQKDDSKNYRECAKELTPLFIDKFSTEKVEKGSYLVKVKNSPVRKNELSGVKLRLYVNNEFMGNLNNLHGVETLELGSLEEGTHEFQFEEIYGYFIDSTGYAHEYEDVAGIECSGMFRVTKAKTFRLLVWLDETGFECDLK